MSFLYMMLRSQLATSLPYPNSDFHDQTIVVTGGNSGLGVESSKHLVRLGATVILAVRNLKRGSAAAEEIVQATGAPRSRVAVWLLDLSSYSSVTAFAQRVNSLNRLDALIQNAGMDDCSEFVTCNGYERMIAVNVVSPVLLGFLTLPKLRESAIENKTTGRLTFVGSALQQLATFQERDAEGRLFDALNDPKQTDMSDRYRVSKLLLLYATRSMAAAMPVSKKSPVMINYVTPGLCNTKIVRKEDVDQKQSVLFKIFKSMFMAILARTPEQGSRTLVDAIKPGASEEFHGAYLRDCAIFPPGLLVDKVEGHNIEKRFFSELQEVLETIHPGSTTVLAN